MESDCTRKASSAKRNLRGISGKLRSIKSPEIRIVTLSSHRLTMSPRWSPAVKPSSSSMETKSERRSRKSARSCYSRRSRSASSAQASIKTAPSSCLNAMTPMVLALRGIAPKTSSQPCMRTPSVGKKDRTRSTLPASRASAPSSLTLMPLAIETRDCS